MSKKNKLAVEICQQRLMWRDRLEYRLCHRVALGCLLLPLIGPEALSASADLAISYPAFDSTIHIGTSAQFGGAISSMTFRGVQYVDTRDHGRELQSAESFDGLSECFNPTEAGSGADFKGPTSSSLVLNSKSGHNWLETKTDMAFWLAPKADYGHACSKETDVSHAVNQHIRDGYVLQKRVVIGVKTIPNVVMYQSTFSVPEAHSKATFEAATLYTPSDFSKRYVFDTKTGVISPTAVFGEQSLPVILATSDGSSAVGLFAPELPQDGMGYGSFNFANTQKINCVFRSGPVKPNQQFKFTCYFAIGNLDEVKMAVQSLSATLR